MTAKATKTTKPQPPTRLDDDEAELKRMSPEYVVKNELLPYKSARVLRQKCYRRQVHCHLDGGRITFTAEDIRRENARTAVAPIAA